MATTVAQHSVATFTSPVNGTTPIDANTVRGNDNTIRSSYNDHDADPGIHVQSSTLASRPVAGTAGRKWITTDAGNQKLWYDDGTDWHEVGGDAINLYCKATETLAKGDVVKITGYNAGQSVPEIAKVASASDVAFGICETAIANGALGYVINTGTISDVATNSFSLGDILYPNTSGGLTATKPTSGNYQPVAYVLRSNLNNGVLYVEFSAPRIVEASANTASTIVRRDASGNFSAGTITAALTGNASTATALSSARTFALTGDITGSVSSDLTSGASIATSIASGVIVDADINASAAIADTKLATISTAGKVANSATTATNANTASAIVARDASGNFSAGTITATLNGAAPAGSLTGTTLASNVVSSSLTSVGTIATGVWQGTAISDTYLATISTAGKVSNSATTATSANTASAIVARDGSGNFTAGTITATLTGTATNASNLTGTTNQIRAVSYTFPSAQGGASTVLTNDGSGNLSWASSGAAAAGTLTGTTLASNVVTSSLTSVGTLTSLTVSGVTTLSAGTAAAPALTTTGDTNTGLYFSAADTVDITTGGTARWRVNSSGHLLASTDATYDIGASGATRPRNYFGSGNGTFGGTLSVTGGATIQGMTVGLGSGSNSSNIAIGTNALGSSNTGTANIAIGQSALINNTSGAENTAIGQQAMVANTTGASNLALGRNTLGSNTSGTGNIAVGGGALGANTTGNSNIAIGGLQANTTGSGNVNLGGLPASTVSSYNVAIGNGALYTFNRTADANGYNTAIGASALLGATTSNYNTAVGANAGSVITTGAKNSILGAYTGNQDGLDIRTSSNYAVISDGDGNRLLSMYNGGTLALDGGAVPQSGTGITFPATQSASSDANTLDDYEEGTWTPAWAFSTSGSATAVSSDSTYTKIGRLVTVRCRIYTSAISSPSGTATITGLPFTAPSAQSYPAGAIAEAKQWNTDMPNLRCRVVNGTTTLEFPTSATNATTETFLSGSDFKSASTDNVLSFTATYIV